MKTTMLMVSAFAAFFSCAGAIPLPEHPRPDWERAEWVNLNGEWDFAFEPKGTPVDASARPAQFDQKIVVPFGWAAPLSGVKGEGDSAWYRREVEIPADWKSQRYFLVVGASDWQTDVFVDGKFVDRHQGGYVPFEVEFTPFAKKGEKATVELRVWDSPTSKDWRLYGKQGYGNARGVWQTVYLEGRGDNYLESVSQTDTKSLWSWSSSPTSSMTNGNTFWDISPPQTHKPCARSRDVGFLSRLHGGIIPYNCIKSNRKCKIISITPPHSKKISFPLLRRMGTFCYNTNISKRSIRLVCQAARPSPRTTRKRGFEITSNETAK